MGKETTAYIGLGSNLGDRRRYIKSSIEMLAGAPELNLTRVSDITESAPLGGADQAKYLNAVAEVQTTLNPQHLLMALADIETLLGRVRSEKWSPRTIDLDLLLFDRQVISSPSLTVPHPQMHLRSFVLKGLAQLNGDLLHPVLAEPVAALAERLNGCDFAPHADRPQLVSVAGIIGVGKTTLAKELVNLLACKILLEPYDTNPFMPHVYAGRKEFALDSQLHFLMGRLDQLEAGALEAGRLAITDYIFEKELIYAHRLLDPQQLALYESVYKPLAENVSRPVLAIYLQDSTESCLERIHRRNRPYEQQIQPEFLDNLSADYDELFADWKTCPVIRLSASKLDYAQTPAIENLANQVKYYIATNGK